jgi:DNA end-binding protein Ku
VARPRAKRRAEAAHQVDPSEARARAFWSGTLAFGLVAIPVYLYPANRRGGVSLRMLADDGTPLERRYHSSETGDEVEDLVRAYEVRPGEYVAVEDEELEALAPERSREIDLRRFVPADSIQPLYFERAYFLTPAGDSNKAYRLLAQVMERTGRTGIATFVMRGKEYLVAILSESGILRAETLRFADEVRTPEAIGLPEKPELDRLTVRRFEKAIEEGTAAALDPEELADGYGRRLERLVEAKRKRGESLTVTPAGESGSEEPAEEPVDLMNVLKWSLRSAEESSRSGQSREKT